MVLNLVLVLGAAVCLACAESPLNSNPTFQHHISTSQNFGLVENFKAVESLPSPTFQESVTNFKFAPVQKLHRTPYSGVNFKNVQKEIFDLPLIEYKYSNPVIKDVRSQSFSVVDTLVRNKITSGGSKIVISSPKGLYDLPKVVKQKYTSPIFKAERSQSFSTVQSAYEAPKFVYVPIEPVYVTPAYPKPFYVAHKPVYAPPKPKPVYSTLF